MMVDVRDRLAKFYRVLALPAFAVLDAVHHAAMFPVPDLSCALDQKVGPTAPRAIEGQFGLYPVRQMARLLQGVKDWRWRARSWSSPSRRGSCGGSVFPRGRCAASPSAPWGCRRASWSPTALIPSAGCYGAPRCRRTRTAGVRGTGRTSPGAESIRASSGGSARCRPSRASSAYFAPATPE